MNTARARLLGLLLLAVVFASGAVAGFAADRVLEAGEPTEARDGERHRGPHPSVLDRLDLTPEQRARVDAILEHRRGQTEAFWEREGSRLRTIVDSTRAEVRAVLTPEQRERYDRLKAEHRARHHSPDRERGLWGRHPGDGDTAEGRGR